MCRDTLMPFSSEEFAVALATRLSFRIAATAATSLADVPAPSKSSIEGTIETLRNLRRPRGMRPAQWATAIPHRK